MPTREAAAMVSRFMVSRRTVSRRTVSRRTVSRRTVSPLAAALATAGALLGFAGLGGCSSNGAWRDDAPASEALERVPADEAARLVAAYNGRVERMERFWARITAVVEGRDAEGSPLKEQGEGHLQLERPGSAALSLGKVGETRLYLGSNDEVYWWIDTIDVDNRVAVEGDLALVSDEKLAALGLPVRPADLSDLLGVRPLPADGVDVLRRGRGGPLLLAADRPSGARVIIEADPERLEPLNVTLLDGRGALARTELASYEPFVVADDRAARGRVATRVRLIARAFEGSISLSIYEPQNKEIKPVAFDPARLYRAFRVERVIDLDDPATAGPGGGG